MNKYSHHYSDCSAYKGMSGGGMDGITPCTVNGSLPRMVRRQEPSQTNTRTMGTRINTHKKNVTRVPRSVATVVTMMPPSSKQDQLFVLPPALFSKPSPPLRAIHHNRPTKNKAPSTDSLPTMVTTTTVKRTAATPRARAHVRTIHRSPTKIRTTMTTTTTSSKTLQTLESALKSRSAKYGPHHAKVAQVWIWMGNYHLQQSECKHNKRCDALVRALDCFRQALSFRKCSESAEALSNIGSIHLKWGNVHRAIGCSQKALSRLRSLQGRQEFYNSRTNTSKAKILLQLGLAYLATAATTTTSQDKDRTTMQQRASDCLFQCLHLSVAAFGPQHSNVGKVYRALARYYAMPLRVAGGGCGRDDDDSDDDPWTHVMEYLVRALDIFSHHKDCIRVVGTLQELVETCVLRQDKVGAKTFWKRREQLLQQPKVQQFFWNCPGLLESAMATTGVLWAKVESLEATNTGTGRNATTLVEASLPFAPSNTCSNKRESMIADSPGLSVRPSTR